MTVYELKHTIYVWEDCDTSVHTLLFETIDDAVEYLSIIKSNIIDEYIKHLDLFSIEELEQYIREREDDTYDKFINEINHFEIELEEYGYDVLSIEKKEILKFK